MAKVLAQLAPSGEYHRVDVVHERDRQNAPLGASADGIVIDDPHASGLAHVLADLTRAHSRVGDRVVARREQSLLARHAREQWTRGDGARDLRRRIARRTLKLLIARAREQREPDPDGLEFGRRQHQWRQIEPRTEPISGAGLADDRYMQRLQRRDVAVDRPGSDVKRVGKAASRHRQARASQALDDREHAQRPAHRGLPADSRPRALLTDGWQQGGGSVSPLTHPTEDRNVHDSTLKTLSVCMEALFTVTVLCPAEDVDRIMREICTIAPLVQGPYDSNAFVSAPGTERYRPLEGAAAGAETAVRERPGVVLIDFEIPRERELLARLVEAVFQVHSYQEPVIKVCESWVSRSKGLDDRDNPHRWWNTTGDWKRSAPGESSGPSD